MNVRDRLRHSPGLWRALRSALRGAVAASTRRVLAPRRDGRDASGTARWLADDVAELLADADAWAGRLRPAARLEALPSESWCRYDWPGSDLIAADGREGHYRRTRTLSRGDAVCDMCWSGTPVGPGDARAAGDPRAMDDDHGEGLRA